MKWQVLVISSAAFFLSATTSMALPGNGKTLSHPSPAACTALLRECVTQDGDQRLHCFHDAAVDERCKGTELGKLSFMRWTTSAPSSTEGFALLGAQLVDRECLANFDNQLSSELIRGTPSSESIQDMTSRLESCHKDAADEVYRPKA